MESLSGNDSDNENFRQTVTTYIEQLQAVVGWSTWAADSTLYTAETLKAMEGFCGGSLGFRKR